MFLKKEAKKCCKATDQYTNVGKESMLSCPLYSLLYPLCSEFHPIQHATFVIRKT